MSSIINLLFERVIMALVESETEDDEEYGPEYELDEWVKGYSDISWEEAKELLEKFGADIEEVKTNTGKTLYIFEYFGEKYVFEPGSGSPSTVQDFLESVSFSGRIEEYVEPLDHSADFWESPPPLYHGTYEENIDSIMEDGLEARDESRGISNRGTGHAIFTTLDPEYAEQHYGDRLIEIDTAAMKQDGYMPRVSPELPIVEYELMGSLAYLVGGENPEELEHGIDYNSMVVFGDIPSKYLKII